MALLKRRSTEQNRPLHVKHSWKSTLRIAVKWFALVILAFLVFGAATYEGNVGRLSGMFFVALSLVSVIYLIVTSLSVRLDFPGIDEDLLDTGRGAAKDVVTTIQVARLDSGGTTIAVANDGILPVLRAQTEFVLVQEDVDKDSATPAAIKEIKSDPFVIPPRSSKVVSTSGSFGHVGIFSLRSGGVRVYSLLGFFSRSGGARGEWRVRVVPNLYRLTQGIPKDRRISQSDLGIPDAPSDALDYDRVRDYRPGDPLKTIHWKIVAHSQGELYTKLFETSTISGVTLLLDPYGPSAQSSLETAMHLYDTMLEGSFSLLEHARNTGFPCHLRFVNRKGLLVDGRWEGHASLGWYVEIARRPVQNKAAFDQSVAAIHSLGVTSAGYTIFATSELCEGSVRALIACHRAGIPLLVIHALPAEGQNGATRQRTYDARLREASVDVIGLLNGSQIAREVSAS